MSFAYLTLYTGDYLRDTRHLTPLKHGIYLLLLMHCWDQKGPLPDDEQDCAGIANCRSADEIDALRYVLGKFFVRMDDGIYNLRMQREIEKAQALSGKRKNAGFKGYEAKLKLLNKKTRQANAKQVSSKSLATASTTNPNPTITTSTTTNPDSSGPYLSKVKNKAQAPFFELPEWIPQEHWDAWIEARTKARKPITDYAKRLAVRKLDNFNKRGHPPAQVLMRSAMNGWADLFEPKE